MPVPRQLHKHTNRKAKDRSTSKKTPAPSNELLDVEHESDGEDDLHLEEGEIPSEEMMEYWMYYHGGVKDDLTKHIDQRNTMYIKSNPWDKPNYFFIGPIIDGVYIGVKVLKRRWLVRYLERNLSEIICKVRTVKHRSLVRLLGCTKDDSREEIYLWQHYVSGVDLQSYLRSNLLNDLTVRVYMRMILAALDVLHANEIVHSKLRCSKIIIHDGIPVIIDYAAPLSVYKNIMRHKYMNTAAPEVTSNFKFDSRSDIWSIGLMCIEMYTRECALPLSQGTQDRLVLKQTLISTKKKNSVEEDDDDEDEDEDDEEESEEYPSLKKPMMQSDIRNSVLMPKEALEWSLKCLNERPPVSRLMQSDFLSAPVVLAEEQRLIRIADNKLKQRETYLKGIRNRTIDESESSESESEQSDT